MPEQQRRRPDWGPGGKMVADGMLSGVERVFEDAGKTMLRSTPPVRRFVAKGIPGVPGLVLDSVEYAQADDKTRKLVGMAGSVIGGAAGGALGTATGPAAPVAAPLGAAAGSVAGEHIAEELYDKYEDDVRRGVGSAKEWLAKRQAGLARAMGERVLPYTPLDRLHRAGQWR